LELRQPVQSFQLFHKLNVLRCEAILTRDIGSGVPKGVMITHYNYIANATQMRFLGTLHPEYNERIAKAYVPFRKNAHAVLLANNSDSAIRAVAE
jgi:hypothetical protein